MTLSQSILDVGAPQGPFRWGHIDTAHVHEDFADPFGPPPSQRQYAKEHGIPRSTVGYWLRQPSPDHLDPALASFFRRPAGVAFLRRLVLALLLVFHHRSPCGLRQIGSFLELAELDHFVGASYGSLYELDQGLQADLDLFAQQERQRLAPGMAAKDVVLCPDENFHGPHVCLVAIEPVSNFILAEAYRDQRDSTTWAKVIREGAEGLPLTIVGLTSDQASGLVCCAEKELQAAHQPDLLHLQHGLAGPVLLPLARPVRQAKKDVEESKREEGRLDRAEREKPGSVTIEVLVAHILAEEQAEQRLEQAQRRMDQAVGQIRGVSAAYHPFDRETGEPVTAEQMQARLAEPLGRLGEVVEEAGLSERAREAVRKAGKWAVTLVGCVAWYWALARGRLEGLGLSEEAQRVLEGRLMAGCYWEVASAKEKAPEERKRLQELARRLKEEAWAEGGVLAALPEAEKAEVARVARQCAALFQRSSSCVEGRNGRLSLFHHGQTRLSEKRLKALTAVHNYVARRADGTTAAERFFGQPQRDAFPWLLDRMPDLPRPAAKRRKTTSGEGQGTL